MNISEQEQVSSRSKSALSETAVFLIERPDPALWTYYLISSLGFLFLFPIVALVLTFKFKTLRYRFTNEGISMSWGILFRRETIINYARIQDIHLRSNVVERWLGLARILVQTASGSSGAEMTIEGVKEFELVRDYLYSKMRGVSEPAPPHSGGVHGGEASDLVSALHEVAAELREIRRLVEARRPPEDGDGRGV